MFGICGGFKREYGGNLKARVGYCDATSAAVGAGTTVEVGVFGSAAVVELEVGVVVVVESFVAAYAVTPDTKETATTVIAKRIRLSSLTLFSKELSLA